MRSARRRVSRAHAPHWRKAPPIATMAAALLVAASAAGTPRSPSTPPSGRLEATSPAGAHTASVAPDARFDAAPRTAFLPPAEKLETIVRQAYDRLAELTAAAGEGVEVRLFDFQTLRADQLDEVLWTDLATLPAEHVIDVVPESRRDALTAMPTVQYHASWRWHEEEWMATEEGRRMIGMTVRDVLREVAQENAAYAGIAAATRYRVHVRLGERERTYRAAVLWRPGDRPGEATFFALDHVLQGVEEAAREKRPTLNEAPLRLDRVTAASTWGTCYSWSDTRNRARTATGSNGHFGSGMHYSGADFSITCACDSACNSTCDAYVNSPICADTGGFNSDACHKMASAIDASSGWQGNALSTGASCAAGLACAQKACLFCACSLGVSVSAFGASVTFGASGSPDWTGHLQFSATCAPCEEVSGGGSCDTDTEIIPDPWEPGDEEEDCGTGGGSGGGDGGDWNDDGGDAGSGGESCADVYCEGDYAGQACGTSAQEMIDEAVDMCGGLT